MARPRTKQIGAVYHQAFLRMTQPAAALTPTAAAVVLAPYDAAWPALERRMLRVYHTFKAKRREACVPWRDVQRRD